MHSAALMAIIVVVLTCAWAAKGRFKEMFTYSGMPRPPLVMTDTIAILP